jgi:hypothetical protein
VCARTLDAGLRRLRLAVGWTGGAASVGQIVARLEQAGYQVSQDRPISHQIEDNSGRKFAPEAFTISRPGTDLFVNLSISSDPGFLRAFRQTGFRAVAIRGDRAYGLSSAGGGGSADLAKVFAIAERSQIRSSSS